MRDGATICELLLPGVESAAERWDTAREIIGTMPDDELLMLHGELARRGEINGPEGELWSMTIAEQAKRWREAKESTNKG